MVLLLKYVPFMHIHHEKHNSTNIYIELWIEKLFHNQSKNFTTFRLEGVDVYAFFEIHVDQLSQFFGVFRVLFCFTFVVTIIYYAPTVTL